MELSTSVFLAGHPANATKGTWQPWLRPCLLAILALMIAGVLLYRFNPEQSGFYPGCMFHSTTGLNCPGCGCLRATHQLLHGHLGAAFHFNPLFIAALPLFSWHFARGIIRSLRGQPRAFDLKPSWLWIGGATLLLFGILRNLPFEIFAWMRP